MFYLFLLIITQVLCPMIALRLSHDMKKLVSNKFFVVYSYLYFAVLALGAPMIWLVSRPFRNYPFMYMEDIAELRTEYLNDLVSLSINHSENSDQTEELDAGDFEVEDDYAEETNEKI